MNHVRDLNLGVRFLLELVALSALAAWGFGTGSTPAARALLGLGAPLLAAVIWGTFVSPRAPVDLPAPAHLLPEAVVLGGAAVALAASGWPGLGLAFAVAAATNRALMTVWGK